MSVFKPGARVGVIGRTTDTGIDFLGYGVYEGEIEASKESKKDGHFGRVKLDNGGEVWAYEYEGCGAEDRLREFLQGRPVREITVEEFRKVAPPDVEDAALRAASEEGVRIGIEMSEAIIKAAQDVVTETKDVESAGTFMMNVANTIASVVIFNICGIYFPEAQRPQVYKLIVGDVSRFTLLVAKKYVEVAENTPAAAVSEPSKIVIP